MSNYSGYTPVKNITFKSLFYENDVSEEDSKKFKLEDISNPKGWKFSEIDLLGDMGFKIDNEHDMVCEIEDGSLNLNEVDKKISVKIYKNDEGYVIEINRRYVFETFEKMIEYFDKIPSGF